MSIGKLLLAACVVLQHATFAYSQPQEILPESYDFAVYPEEIATVKYKNRNLRVFASLKNRAANKEAPSLWQFRYDPLLLPEYKSDGAPNTSVKGNGSQWTVMVPIQINDDGINNLVLSTVKQIAGPSDGAQINTYAVAPLRLSEITIEWKDATAEILTTKSSDTVRFGLGMENSIVISLPTKSEQDAKQLEKLIGSVRFFYKVSFSSARVTENAIAITVKQLRESSLYAKLDGLNPSKTDRYVRRNDLRKLSEDLVRNIAFDAIIEDREQFNHDMGLAIIDKLSTSIVSSDGFNEEQWKSTYNSRDLEPDTVTKTLNKLFTWDKGNKVFKVNGNINLEQAASLLDIVSLGAKAGGAFSKEELQSYLKKNEITSEFEGVNIIAKSVDLSRVNMTNFEGTGTFVQRFVMVRRQMSRISGEINMPSVSKQQIASARVDLPLATILPWHKNIGGTELSLPTGWMECNGDELPSDSPLRASGATRVPNLNTAQGYRAGRFIRGGLRSGEMADGTRHFNGFLENGSLTSQEGKWLFEWDDLVRSHMATEFAYAPQTAVEVPPSSGTFSRSAPVNMTVVFIIRTK